MYGNCAGGGVVGELCLVGDARDKEEEEGGWCERKVRETEELREKRAVSRGMEAEGLIYAVWDINWRYKQAA
jgi:hypothetical protein